MIKQHYDYEDEDEYSDLLDSADESWDDDDWYEDYEDCDEIFEDYVLCPSCGIYPAEVMRGIVTECAGCEAYRDHFTF